MRGRDYHDVLGGLLMVVVGLVFAVYSRDYELGTPSRMGSGMFPMLLGYLLAVLGVVIAVPALRRSGELPRFALRPYLLVLCSVVAFALLVDHVGMVPVTVLLVCLAGAAERNFSLRRSLWLAAVLSALAVLIFRVGLSLPIPAFAWRF